jgi:hypothetical protein
VAQTTSSNAGGNIAHLGGALIGFLFIKQLKRGNDIGKPVNSILGYFENIILREKTMKVSYKNTNKNEKSNAPTQEEIDNILDKISQKGYGSLNKEEKQKLFQASQN